MQRRHWHDVDDDEDPGDWWDFAGPPEHDGHSSYAVRVDPGDQTLEPAENNTHPVGSSGQPAWVATRFSDRSGSCGSSSQAGPSESLGAAKHDQGRCAPCHYHNSATGCKKGDSCGFCHLHDGDHRPRPSKGKRARAKAMIQGSDLNVQGSLDGMRHGTRTGSYIQVILRSTQRKEEQEQLKQQQASVDQEAAVRGQRLVTL